MEDMFSQIIMERNAAQDECAMLRELNAELVQLLKDQPALGDDDKMIAWFHRKRAILTKAGAK